MERQGVGLSLLLLVLVVAVFIGCGKLVQPPPPPLGKIVISEVLHHPIGPEPDDERITLENTGGQSVDISGWELTDGEGRYRIPGGTTVAPNEEWAVTGRHYNRTRYTGGMFLANDHDSVELYDHNKNLVDSKTW